MSTLVNKSLTEFAEELSSNSPAPGGGSTAALAGALGAALTAMVCTLTIGKKKYAEYDSEMQDILVKAQELRGAMLAIVDSDTAAFDALMSAFAMPKETDEQRAARDAEIQRATIRATESPMGIMRLCRQTLELTGAVAVRGNQNAISDAGVSALMLGAASQGAALNVRINLPAIRDEQYVKRTFDEMIRLETEVGDLEDRVLSTVQRALAK